MYSEVMPVASSINFVTFWALHFKYVLLVNFTPSPPPPAMHLISGGCSNFPYGKIQEE